MKQLFKYFNIIFRFSLFLILFCIFSPKIIAQDSVLYQKIDLNTKNQELINTLDKISNITGYNFTYDANVIEGNKLVNINAQNETLINILNTILNDTALNYKIIDNQIVIYKYNEKTNENILTKNKTTSNIITITGIVKDSYKKKPLPFATISIFGKDIGTISNSDGEFVFNIPVEIKNDENLIVSYMGYKNFEIPINKINHSENIIYLEKDFVTIQEVLIRNANPISLIREAINNVKKNYGTTPVMFNSFYRETVNNNNRYVVYSEAIMEIYKSSYTNLYDFDRIKVLKGRKCSDVNKTDTILIKLRSGPNSCLNLDIVKNHLSFIDEEYFDVYNYKIADITIFNNKLAYIIEFEQKNYIVDPLYKGKIYIEVYSLAITNIEFCINPDRIRKSKKSFVIKKPKNVKVKPIFTKYKVSYREINGRYYLNHVRGELKFKVKYRKKLFNSVFETAIEMATNNIDTVNIRKFKNKERIRTNEIFFDKKFEYDELFWGSYNFIIPEESLQEALKRINKNNQQYKHTD
ncbi:MAG: carboxypeptidase-like regulatory domain-containing protein [Bacteroidales bacterium]|nr:carboxypeptidase-like regulatory domain-containing protein [Bacteroidales bacterium]